MSEDVFLHVSVECKLNGSLLSANHVQLYCVWKDTLKFL